MTDKIDPRVTRTKQLLVDAFQKVSKEKKLSQLTVKNITDEATVNRATFYGHFTDKYDILDYSLDVTILKDLNDTLNISNIINEIVLKNIFITMTQYMEQVQASCEMNQDVFCEQAHKRINNELEDIFSIMLENSYSDIDRDILVSSASFLAAGMSGLCNHWLSTSHDTAENFIDKNLPFLIHHIAHL